MSRSNRLFRLLDTLRRLPPPVTASRLAGEMGVTQRTIYRDIDSLRAAGALIDGEAGYGYTLTEDTAVPPQMFDRLELEALMLGLGWLEWQGDPALAEAAKRAIAKVTASLPARKAEEARHVALLAYAFEPRPQVPQFMPVLREAAWEERAVDITYTDRKGAFSARRVWPLSLVYTEQEPWLLAHCCLREGFRTFRMSRIESVTATEESFRPRRVSLLREMMEFDRNRRAQW